ncbi:MAG: MGH1-like glycoside hydrolase domain-containing protein [Trebonia sp.]
MSIAHVDPGFAKYQLILLCREWFQHPNGALPAYEWDFGDVNPPVQAWAALQVFGLDGGQDLDFLARIFDKLLVNFTWWVNREDLRGSNLFEGGLADRPVTPAGRREPGTVRRHRVDGVLRPVDGRDRVDSLAGWPTAGRRPGAEVPRALRRHR